MRNRTPIERINDEVELGIAKAFPRLLLDMELERHTRKGTRLDCDCEYCTHKKHLSARFHLSTSLIKTQKHEYETWGVDMSNPYPRTRYGSCSGGYDEQWWMKQVIRHSIRTTARKELRAIKEEVE